MLTHLAVCKLRVIPIFLAIYPRYRKSRKGKKVTDDNAKFRKTLLTKSAF